MHSLTQLIILALLATAGSQWSPAAATASTCTSFLLSGNGVTAASVDGPPHLAQYRTPRGLAYDPVSTFLVLVENGGHKVRRVSTVTGNSSTLAGSGTASFQDGPGSSAGFSGPLGCAVNSSGFVLVADAGNHRVRVISPVAPQGGNTFGFGEVSTLAGQGGAGWLDGPSATALFSFPRGITTDSTSGTV
jgi:hypothetical protein